jgi:GntR family transcriptional repressor for pyruvate dehydrogenase complex
MLTSTRAPRVYEHIAERLERAILDGRLREGDKLAPERTLARDFGASRVAVREALRTLEHRGLLAVRHGAAGGYFVRAIDGGVLGRDLRTLLRVARVSPGQLMEARLVVEPEIAHLAALRANELDVKALLAILDDAAALVAGGADPREADLRFHHRVARTARNPVHALLIDALMEVEIGEAPQPRLSGDHRARVDGIHQEIVDAIASRDPERARAAMTEHLLALQSWFGAFQDATASLC